MARPHRSDLSSDLLEDFRLDAAEQFPRCEQLLIELERAPKSTERLRELFRLIHTLKGNLGYVELNELMPLPQAMEDVLDALRSGRLTFDSLLGDVLLLNLDHLRELIREALGGGAARINPAQMLELSEALHSLAGGAPARQSELRRTLLQLCVAIVEADAVVKGQTASSSYKPAILDNGVRIMVPPHIGSGTRIIVDVYEQAYVGKAN